MKKIIKVISTLVILTGVFIGCTTTQLEKYFELENTETTETVEEVENERQ